MQIGLTVPRTRLRLGTVLILVNVAFLILPLGAAFFFRFYENELVRQTERELISQSAVIAALYKSELAQRLPNPGVYGIPVPNYKPPETEEGYDPIEPQLDMSKITILPQRPAGVARKIPPRREEYAAGKAIEKILLDARKTTLSGVRILNSDGIVVYGHNESGLSLADLPEIKSALGGHYTSVIRQRVSNSPPPPLASISRGNLIRVFTAFPAIQDGKVWGVVYASRTPQSIRKYVYSQQDHVVWAIGTIAALVLLMAFMTSFLISRPIYRLIDRTRRIAAGDKSAMAPLESPRTREVELLSESFSAMAAALQARSEYMRTFAMHVSHEFKTPLTAIRGAAEILQDYHDIDAAKRDHFLSLILQSTDRLKLLVSRLLELARADNITPADGRTDLLPLLGRLRDRYRGVGLELKFDESANYTALVAPDNLETVLVNLLDNARQHGANKVEIGPALKNHVLTLTVQDDGHGISAANRDKVFTPFFTTRREDGGTGLGLDIVRSILERHGGQITLADSERGARFVLEMPGSV